MKEKEKGGDIGLHEKILTAIGRFFVAAHQFESESVTTQEKKEPEQKEQVVYCEALRLAHALVMILKDLKGEGGAAQTRFKHYFEHIKPVYNRHMLYTRVAPSHLGLPINVSEWGEARMSRLILSNLYMIERSWVDSEVFYALEKWSHHEGLKLQHEAALLITRDNKGKLEALVAKHYLRDKYGNIRGQEPFWHLPHVSVMPAGSAPQDFVLSVDDISKAARGLLNELAGSMLDFETEYAKELPWIDTYIPKHSIDYKSNIARVIHTFALNYSTTRKWVYHDLNHGKDFDEICKYRWISTPYTYRQSSYYSPVDIDKLSELERSSYFRSQNTEWILRVLFENRHPFAESSLRDLLLCEKPTKEHGSMIPAAFNRLVQLRRECEHCRGPLCEYTLVLQDLLRGLYITPGKNVRRIVNK